MRVFGIVVVGLMLTGLGVGQAAAHCGGCGVQAEKAPEHAEVGKAAPDFRLKGVDGKEVSLSSLKGKTVVLEWFNPGCPFVKRVHLENGPMPAMVKKHVADGGVWLAINSGAEGKQGAGKEANTAALKTYGITWPLLLDGTGEVGKIYGAKRTPEVYVIDAKGVLVYAGGVDSTRGAGYDGKPFTNHLQDALDAVKAGKKPALPQTKAWGCSVKY